MMKKRRLPLRIALSGIILPLGLIVFLLFSPVALARQDFYTKNTWDGIFREKDLNGCPIVFVYGIGGSFKDWEKTLKTISGSNYYNIGFSPAGKVYHNYHGEKQSIWVWNASYYTSDLITELIQGNLSLYAERLETLISVIKKVTQKDKVVIIAHSMGGLVARKYMTLNQSNWDSVYKILTVATPNEGVATSIGVVGQLADLEKNSNFINTVNSEWSSMKNHVSKWGVVGAIDTKLFFNRKDAPDATDSSGLGYIAISSAIPFGEWKDAAVVHLNRIVYNTPHFAFRLAVHGRHLVMLYNEATFKGIYWAVRK